MAVVEDEESGVLGPFHSKMCVGVTLTGIALQLLSPLLATGPWRGAFTASYGIGHRSAETGRLARSESLAGKALASSAIPGLLCVSHILQADFRSHRRAERPISLQELR